MRPWPTSRMSSPACSTIASARTSASSIHSSALPNAPPPTRVSSAMFRYRVEFLQDRSRDGVGVAGRYRHIDRADRRRARRIQLRPGYFEIHRVLTDQGRRDRVVDDLREAVDVRLALAEHGDVAEDVDVGVRPSHRMRIHTPVVFWSVMFLSDGPPLITTIGLRSM
jgi:hypothetical protein